MFMPTGTAQTRKNATASASDSVNKHATLQICTRLCKFAPGSANLHVTDSNLQSALFICKPACSFAEAHAYVHSHLFICTRLCTDAQRRVGGELLFFTENQPLTRQMGLRP